MNVLADYKCTKCEYVEEKMVERRGASGWPIFDCVECEEGRLYKVFAPNNAIFGKGFPGNDIKRGR